MHKNCEWLVLTKYYSSAESFLDFTLILDEFRTYLNCGTSKV